MSFLETYLSCALGIAISILIPILRESLPRPSTTRGRFESFFSRLWPIAKPYLILGLFSLAGGIVIVALAKNSLTDWQAAFLAGYAWDSTLQKFKGEKVRDQEGEPLHKA